MSLEQYIAVSSLVLNVVWFFYSMYNTRFLRKRLVEAETMLKEALSKDARSGPMRGKVETTNVQSFPYALSDEEVQLLYKSSLKPGEMREYKEGQLNAGITLPMSDWIGPAPPTRTSGTIVQKQIEATLPKGANINTICKNCGSIGARHWLSTQEGVLYCYGSLTNDLKFEPEETKDGKEEQPKADYSGDSLFF